MNNLILWNIILIIRTLSRFIIFRRMLINIKLEILNYLIFIKSDRAMVNANISWVQNIETKSISIEVFWKKKPSRIFFIIIYYCCWYFIIYNGVFGRPNAYYNIIILINSYGLIWLYVFTKYYSTDDCVRNVKLHSDENVCAAGTLVDSFRYILYLLFEYVRIINWILKRIRLNRIYDPNV